MTMRDGAMRFICIVIPEEPAPEIFSRGSGIQS